MTNLFINLAKLINRLKQKKSLWQFHFFAFKWVYMVKYTKGPKEDYKLWERTKILIIMKGSATSRRVFFFGEKYEMDKKGFIRIRVSFS